MLEVSGLRLEANKKISSNLKRSAPKAPSLRGAPPTLWDASAFDFYFSQSKDLIFI